jgi:diguanylate cyclase (GGDEF)-like protein
MLGYGMRNHGRGGDGMGPILLLASLCFSLSGVLWAQRVARRAACAEERALIDPLTGVFNRRGWDALIARELARSQRGETTMTVFVMDIDEFKLINDTYGHVRGDQVLKEVASAIRSSARANDVVARMGGDEFALLALDDGNDLPDLLLRRLEAAVAASGVTLSVGYAKREPRTSLTAAMDAADQQMYRNKAARRASGGPVHGSVPK